MIRGEEGGLMGEQEARQVEERLLEDPRYQVGLSVLKAFDWALTTDKDEIDSIRNYAREEGLDEPFIDWLLEQARTDQEKWADGTPDRSDS